MIECSFSSNDTKNERFLYIVHAVSIKRRSRAAFKRRGVHSRQQYNNLCNRLLCKSLQQQYIRLFKRIFGPVEFLVIDDFSDGNDKLKITDKNVFSKRHSFCKLQIAFRKAAFKIRDQKQESCIDCVFPSYFCNNFNGFMNTKINIS